MRRTEYRLWVVWPTVNGLGQHEYGKTFFQSNRAAKAAAEYRAQGATVTVEVWSCSSDGWYHDVDRTTQYAAQDAK